MLKKLVLDFEVDLVLDFEVDLILDFEVGLVLDLVFHNEMLKKC